MKIKFDIRKISKMTAIVLTLGTVIATTGCGENKPKTAGEPQYEEIRKYTGFFGSNGSNMSDDNEIRNMIAVQTGAMCVEDRASGESDETKVVSDMIASGSYPDFVSPDALNYQRMVKAGAFIPIDSYWDDYPNLKNYFTEEEWDRIREEDGHIYIVPQFSNCYMQDTSTYHNDEAFWIQVKVLEWAGYPEIETLDEYFDLIEEYIKANPTDQDGEPYIGYEILANDSMFFSLDNPPMFLDGYPNDGCCIVNPETLQAEDYNLSPTAEKWFRKLNEEYKKGIVDKDCFLMTTEQYYEKLATGRVLGMTDQYWNFNNSVKNLSSDCTYIPLGPVIEEGIEEHYHSRTAFNGSTGVGITVSCTDPEGAVKFLNDLLSPEILTLRFWGVEGVDYTVGEDGIFYQTDEQRVQWRDTEYAKNHICLYSYFPYYWGMDQDGINAYCSSYQPQEFYKTLSEDVKKCFDAYGVRTYVEMLNDAPDNPDWYPMWSYSSTLTGETEAGNVMNEIEQAKHEYLPQLVMAEDFDSLWNEYTEYYSNIDSQVYFDELTAEVRRRMGK